MARPSYDLWDSEQDLLDAVRSGQALRLSDKIPELPGSSIIDTKRTIRARVIRDLMLGRWVDDPDPLGIQLRGVLISERLHLTHVRTQLSLELLHCTLVNTANLYDCQLPRLVLRGSCIRGLMADRLRLEGGLMAQGLVSSHPLSLRGARIGSHLMLDGARIEVGSNCALQADGVRVAGDVLLRGDSHRGPFRARGDAEEGLIHLSDASIDGSLDADQAELTNLSGPALVAERANVAGAFCLRGSRISGSRVRGASSSGAVMLTGAHIGAQLIFSGSAINGHGAPALMGDSLFVAGNLFLDGIDSAGDGPDAVVRLVGSRVEGSLTCHGSRIVRQDSPGLALDLRHVGVGKMLNLPRAVVESPPAVPALHRDDPVAARTDVGKIALDGLTYPGIPEGQSPEDWLILLRNQTSEYAAQPYRQLAAVYMAAGRESEARAFLIAQQDDILARGELRGVSRLRHRTLQFTIGYGYQSWRALALLSCTVLLAVFFVLAVCSPAGIVVHRDGSNDFRHCSIVAQVGLGLNLVVPLVRTVNPGQCFLDSRRTSTEWEVGFTWIFQVLGWSLTSLFIVGYTGLVRKA